MEIVELFSIAALLQNNLDAVLQGLQKLLLNRVLGALDLSRICCFSVDDVFLASSTKVAIRIGKAIAGVMISAFASLLLGIHYGVQNTFRLIRTGNNFNFIGRNIIPSSSP